MKVGFIGLGRMGSGMARRILERRPRAARLRRGRGSQVSRARRRGGARGGRVVAGRRLRRPRRVVTMLVEDAAVIDVALGTGGSARLAAARRHPPGHGHARRGDDPRARSAPRGERARMLVAAPVLGRPDLAASGQLGIVAAGTEQALRALRAAARASWASGSSSPARSPNRPRRSSSPTTPCSAAPWWRWPKASRWSASTASSRRCSRT